MQSITALHTLSTEVRQLEDDVRAIARFAKDLYPLVQALDTPCHDAYQTRERVDAVRALSERYTGFWAGAEAVDLLLEYLTTRLEQQAEGHLRQLDRRARGRHFSATQIAQWVVEACTDVGEDPLLLGLRLHQAEDSWEVAMEMNYPYRLPRGCGQVTYASAQFPDAATEFQAALAIL